MNTAPDNQDYHTESEFTQDILSSLWPIYYACVETLEQHLWPWQEIPIDILARKIHDLNTNTERSPTKPLETIVLRWSGDHTKQTTVQALSEFLLGDPYRYVYIDCKFTPDINPYDYYYLLEEEALRARYYPLHPHNLQQWRKQGYAKEALHRIAEKHPGLALIYINNFNHLTPQVQEDFLDLSFWNPNTLLEKSILLLGSDDEQDKLTRQHRIGFYTQNSHLKSFPTSLHPFLASYPRAEFAPLNTNQIQHLVATLSKNLLEELSTVPMSIHESLVTNFHNHYLNASESLNEYHVIRMWSTTIKPLMQSFVQNNKHLLETLQPGKVINLSLKWDPRHQEIVGNIATSQDPLQEAE